MRISDPERAALESLERMYGLVVMLTDRYGVETDATIIKQTDGRYSRGTWTIEEMLQRVDEVLEHAKARS